MAVTSRGPWFRLLSLLIEFEKVPSNPEAEQPLPLPTLRGQTPITERIRRRLLNRWRKFFPVDPDGMTLRKALGLPERRKATPEEIIEYKRHRREEDEQRRRESDWRKEARLFSKKASQTLDTPCGIRHVLEGKRANKIQMVRFMDHCSSNGNIIFLKADTLPGHFPHGHNLGELRKPEILEIVGANLQREVMPWYSQYNGGGYMVYRNIGAEGFPVFVDYADMWEKYLPASLAKDHWAVPLGLGYNSRSWWRSFPDLGHILIAGTTGWGKSVRANSLICSLIENNDPKQLTLIFCDFKGGIEFNAFKNLPHIGKIPRIFIQKKHKDDETLPESVEDMFNVTGEKEPVSAVITKPFLMPGLLWWVNREANRRFEIITSASPYHKNVSDYNQWAYLNQRSPLSRIVVFIDEWSVIAHTRSIAPVCADLLCQTANIARAAGIQIVICTQHPDRDVLPGSVISATNTRFVCRLTDQYMSRSILQSNAATDLCVKGRFVVQSDGIENEVLQTPFISNETIQSIVEGAEAHGGRIEKRERMPVSAEEIFAWALSENKGFLGSREIFDHFRQRGMSKHMSEKFGPNWEGDIVNIRSTKFRVMPETDFPSRLPRRLLAAEEIITGDGNDITNIISACPQSPVPPGSATDAPIGVPVQVEEDGHGISENNISKVDGGTGSNVGGLEALLWPKSEDYIHIWLDGLMESGQGSGTTQTQTA